MPRKMRFRAPQFVSATPEDRRVILSLYKSLLRLAGKFDKEDTAKALLYRSQRPLHNPYMEGSSQDGEKYYGAALDRIFLKSILLSPDRAALALTDVVKAQFRAVDEESPQTKIHGAFKAIRSFSSVWSLYTSRGSWNVASLLHTLPRPLRPPIPAADRLFPGVVLAAHPLVHGPLSRAVILVLQHEKEGSYGVVINHRSRRTVSEVVKNLPGDVVHTFGSNPTHYGGPMKRLQCIHNLPHMDGQSIPVAAVGDEFQLYTGGVTERNIAELSASGDKEKIDLQNRFHFFTGCCTWSANELADQVEEGFWIPLVLSAEDIWSLIEQVQPLHNRDSENAAGDAAISSAEEEEKWYRKAIDAAAAADEDYPERFVTPGGRTRNTGWAWVMDGAGGAYSDFSRVSFMLDVEDVDSVD